MVKTKLNSTLILNEIFPSSKKGYDSDAVDSFLDKVLADYRLIEKNHILTEEEITTQKKHVEELNNKIHMLEIELGKFKARFQNIKEGDNVTKENIDLLKKINVYEKALYAAGIDPTKLK